MAMGCPFSCRGTQFYVDLGTGGPRIYMTLKVHWIQHLKTIEVWSECYHSWPQRLVATLIHWFFLIIIFYSSIHKCNLDDYTWLSYHSIIFMLCIDHQYCLQMCWQELCTLASNACIGGNVHGYSWPVGLHCFITKLKLHEHAIVQVG